MSEDSAAGFNAAAMPGKALQICADSAALAALIEAAGWPVSPGACALVCDVYVLDWHDAVGVDPAKLALSSDCALLCIASLETLDQADALLQARDVHYVIGRDTAQIGAALAEIAASRARPALNDRDSDERARLQALADDLARLAEQLAALSQPGTGDDDDDAADDAADAVPSLADPSHAFRAEPQEYARAQSAVGARELRELIAMRRLRGRFFDPVLFADPAWDMILDLSAARLEGKTVSVSSLCIASAVPPTTALRWIRLMTESGLLERRADPADARRVFTALSDSAWAQMKGWLAAAAERGAFGI